MNWENLTAPDFQKAVAKTPVCIIALGVIERHGDHLPLGTDFLNGHKLATMAAEKEEVIVFPPFYFGQIYEAKCFSGTITLKPRLLLDLLQNVLDEIGRNGIEKIILLNAHGGNDAFLKFLTQCQISEERSYQVYMYNRTHSQERAKLINNVCETKTFGHACEYETSISLFNHQELVKMDQISDEEYLPLKRLADVGNNFSALSWYSNYPEHYVGNANYASYEKGKALVEFEVNELAKYIAAVKKDEVLPSLNKEFHSRVAAIKK